MEVLQQLAGILISAGALIGLLIAVINPKSLPNGDRVARNIGLLAVAIAGAALVLAGAETRLGKTQPSVSAGQLHTAPTDGIVSAIINVDDRTEATVCGYVAKDVAGLDSKTIRTPANERQRVSLDYAYGSAVTINYASTNMSVRRGEVWLVGLCQGLDESEGETSHFRVFWTPLQRQWITL